MDGLAAGTILDTKKNLELWAIVDGIQEETADTSASG